MKKIIVILIVTVYLSSLFCFGIQTKPNITDENSIIQLKTSSDEYFDLLDNIFEFSEEELALLDLNDFLVLNRLASDDIQDMYDFYWQEDLPIFITTDTVLHVWHLLFDKSLEHYEQNVFYPLLTVFSAKVVEALETLTEDNLAYEHALIYSNVAAKILDPEFNVTESVSPEVNFLIDIIDYGKGFWESGSLLTTVNLGRFICDYSQFKPRGHYTHSIELGRYFKAYKWYSKIPFFFNVNDMEESDLGYDTETMVKSALYLIWSSQTITVSFQNEDWSNELQRMVNTTYLEGTGSDIMSFFDYLVDVLAGRTNKVNYLDLNWVTQEITQDDNWQVKDISDKELNEIIISIVENNSISSLQSPHEVQANLLMHINASKAFFMFGEALTLDTYALNKLVDPYNEERCLPKGLDLPAVCFESERALYHLNEELTSNSVYQSAMSSTQEDLKTIPTDEKQSIHWQWVESLRPLTAVVPESSIENPSLPNFMKTDAWLDEKITTVMGSWTQLKHDMILYSKMGITPTICSTPFGYVEPYPKCYTQLESTISLYTEILNSFVEKLNVDTSNWFSNYITSYIPYLEVFSESLDQLASISTHELAGVQLSVDEKEFIQSTYSIDTCSSGGPVMSGWLGKLLQRIARVNNYEGEPNTRSSLVADIHTDTNTGDTLHLATGLLEHIIVKVPGWNTEETYAVGPVFSYYEFVLPNYLRFCDEDWQSILNLHIEDPENEIYDFSYLQRGSWASSYMISTEISTSTLYEDETEFNVPEWFYKPSSDWAQYNTSTPDTNSYNFSGYISDILETNTQNTTTILVVEFFLGCLFFAFIRKNRRKK